MLEHLADTYTKPLGRPTCAPLTPLRRNCHKLAPKVKRIWTNWTNNLQNLAPKSVFYCGAAWKVDTQGHGNHTSETRSRGQSCRLRHIGIVSATDAKTSRSDALSPQQSTLRSRSIHRDNEFIHRVAMAEGVTRLAARPAKALSVDTVARKLKILCLHYPKREIMAAFPLSKQPARGAGLAAAANLAGV